MSPFVGHWQFSGEESHATKGNPALAGAHLFKYLYLSHFSQPSWERTLYRSMRLTRPRKILEVGLADAVRSRRLIEVAQRYQPAGEIEYVGIDLFEARPSESPGIPLKEAHRRIKPLGCRVQLVPGDPFSALARTANSLRAMDLVIVSADQDPASLARAWFYVPRILHEGSRVHVEEVSSEPGKRVLRPLLPLDVVRLAKAASGTRRAA
jgi:hypothetical protein